MSGSAELEPISGRGLTAVDATIGVTASAIGVATVVGRRVSMLSRPVAALVLRPPLVAERLQPGTWLVDAARRGADRRERLVAELSALLDVLVPVIADAMIRRMDLTDVVRRYVDLDALVGSVDLDGAVAGVDLDGIVATVDIDAIAARIDITAILDRIDLAGLAEEVIAEIDLPEIIRESTGSMASETVRGVRMQGITADEAVGRAVDRFRLRRTRTVAPVPPEAPPEKV